eukprot:TRINITY_DN16297_c0_g1_i1.p1 TRINITY_DN16297_c0_g1~~TRINITY_DN16297_c0_g1_i1.p1  ORF type:complete len:127 (+),score=23.47 TRINITY_DN16297_c0_g1_i1:234-614(+)
MHHRSSSFERLRRNNDNLIFGLHEHPQFCFHERGCRHGACVAGPPLCRSAGREEPYWDLDVALLDQTRTPHGLLEQTAHHMHPDGDHHRTKSKQRKGGEIEGSYKDYDTDFIFNKFVLTIAAVEMG